MEVLNQIFLFCNSGLGKVVLVINCVYLESRNHIYLVYLSFPRTQQMLRNLAELVLFLTGEVIMMQLTIKYIQLFLLSYLYWRTVQSFGVCLRLCSSESKPCNQDLGTSSLFGKRDREERRANRSTFLCWLQLRKWAQSFCRASEDPWRTSLGNAPP